MLVGGCDGLLLIFVVCFFGGGGGGGVFVLLFCVCGFELFSKFICFMWVGRVLGLYVGGSFLVIVGEVEDDCICKGKLIFLYGEFDIFDNDVFELDCGMLI